MPRKARGTKIHRRPGFLLVNLVTGSIEGVPSCTWYFDEETSWRIALQRTHHQCDPGLIPGLGVKCGLSLLLVLVFALRGVSSGAPVFSSPQKPTVLNYNSIRTQWTKKHPVDVPLLIPIYLFIYILLHDEGCQAFLFLNAF